MPEITFTDTLVADAESVEFTTAIAADFTIEYITINAERPIEATVRVELAASGGADFDVILHMDTFFNKENFVWLPVPKTRIQSGSEVRIVVTHHSHGILESGRVDLAKEPEIFVTVGHTL